MRSMLELGDVFEKKYVIRELLGAGGFALVYRAEQPDVDRSVAIKILRPAEDIGTHPTTLLARFQREAKMAAELRNEHNIRLFDFGRSSRGFLYMIFEYVNGTALDDVIRATGPMTPRRVVRVLTQILEALDEAHQLGILHRDVKPGNIIIFERLGLKDRAKLIDYGIAKPMKAAGSGDAITAEGRVVGTPRYMAPEQILMMGDLTPATDIYSLGLVGYEMLAGKSLLGDSTHTEVIKRQLSGEVFRVPSNVPAPPGLREVINRMLAKSARDRFQAADDALEALLAVDVDEEPETLPPVEQLLEQLEEAPPTVDSADMSGEEATVDSRPMAKLRESNDFAAGGHDSGEAPPTRESAPDVLGQKLASDSADRTSDTQTQTRGGRLTVGVSTALAVFAIAALVVALGVGVLIWRSRTAREVAKSVTSEIDKAATSVGCSDDDWEPNNRSYEGTKLHSGSKKGFLCPGDVDWYRLGHHSAGDNVRVAVDYEPGEDDIDIELFVDANFEGGVYTPEKREIFDQKVKHSGIVAVRLYFPNNDSGEGRAYEVMREFESAPEPPVPDVGTENERSDEPDAGGPNAGEPTATSDAAHKQK